MTNTNKHKTNMDILGPARANSDLFVCPIHVSWLYHQLHETNACRGSLQQTCSLL